MDRPVSFVSDYNDVRRNDTSQPTTPFALSIQDIFFFPAQGGSRRQQKIRSLSRQPLALELSRFTRNKSKEQRLVS